MGGLLCNAAFALLRAIGWVLQRMHGALRAKQYGFLHAQYDGSQCA